MDVPAIRSNIWAIRNPVRRSISARIIAGMIPRIPPPSMDRMVNKGILVSCQLSVVSVSVVVVGAIVVGTPGVGGSGTLNLVFGDGRCNSEGT